MNASVAVPRVCSVRRGAVTNAGGRDVDAAALRRVAQGDGDALAELYERHGTLLFRYVLRLTGDRQLSEEVLQDTLLAAWRSASRFEGRSTVRTWLLGIARRQVHNRLRGSHANIAVELEAVAELASEAPGPEEALLVSDAKAEVAEVVAELSPVHREILGLAFADELSYAEMAGVLEVPLGTVKSRLLRAKAALAARLSAR